jgi:hypothetical protein
VFVLLLDHNLDGSLLFRREVFWLRERTTSVGLRDCQDGLEPDQRQLIVDRIEIHDPVVHCLDYGLWQGVLLPQERVQEDVGRSCVRHLCQLQDGNGGMDRRNRFLVKVLATFTMILARISASLMVVVGSSHSGKSTPLNQAAGLKKPLLKAL